ncbi:sporulation protein rmd5 [Echinococcus multilocularis]|uniref:Sporulation protein rmd5 n=1 Tax=Echinococcus multilocularis TaxID=6211 RepID=A0A068YFW4_ECHMU|nr:sporulation protein rmd5 [Echinococcus multilocularis]
MTSGDESGIREKLEALSNEVDKVEKGLAGFKNIYELKAEKYLDSLSNLIIEIQSGNSGSCLSPETKVKICSLLSNVKSNFSDALKKHRDIHACISKFKKFIDKTFVDDISNVASYFTTDTSNVPTSNATFDPAPSSNLYKTADNMTEDELFAAIIIEELIRSGYGSVAIKLAKEVGFSEEDIGLKHFREVGAMVAALKNGELGPAKEWLATNSESLGPKTKQLEYVLAKLEFLMDVQRCADDPSGVIACLRKIVPYASDFPTDFEHIMGSLVFLGQDLNETPYSDLSLKDPAATATVDNANVKSQFASTGGVHLPILPLVSLCAGEEEAEEEPAVEMTVAGDGTVNDVATIPLNAFVRAAHLFGTVACAKLSLSSIDPLRTAFASGLQVLPKLHKLQRAFAWLTNYAPGNSDGTHTLPISVDLDTVAHRHNIFHCPVIKEVSTLANPAVRLNCGHAISRDAFNSLANSERRSRKIKCPYCPKDTSRDQVMTLYF